MQVYLQTAGLRDLLQEAIIDREMSRVLPAGGAAQLLPDSLPQLLRLLELQRRRLQNLFTLWDSEQQLDFWMMSRWTDLIKIILG